VATAQQLIDADAFLARPEGPREELVEGRVVVNEPTHRHQAAVLEIANRLLAWIASGHDRGRVSLALDLRISDRDVLAPDVLWYSDRERLEVDAPVQIVAPELVVEVRSQSTWSYDVGLKRERYERWGVDELWLVDTESRSVLVHRRSAPQAPTFDVALEVGEAQTLRSPLVPGFELPVAVVFAV